ncbi:flagellar biosynthesis protein FliH [Sphingomonas changnyeongensis]|uniref:Flagellar assembly protein FliH n=1 Tax=Sphingomonas changnyeongensis TaxID=2698679 RepID=A0A7Z2NVS6_9SPHN|nr:FliH/SctL family protein [Sphingomonas changnyeongensis]QHL90169.1 flagellar biosynthesis protein FliH [Sphingomonas changnyeongensis]
MSDRFARARAVDAGALGAAMAAMHGGFAAGLGMPAEAAPPAAADPSPAPRHFRPAAPGARPTAGWDPFDPMGDGRFGPRPADPSPAPPPAACDNEAIRAEAYAAGLAAGRAEAAEAGATGAALTAIADRLAAMATLQHARLAERLRATVLHLTAQIVGEAVPPAELTAARIAAAAALIVDRTAPAGLRLNPEDAVAIGDHLPHGLAVTGDAALARGAFVIETRDGEIMDGPDQWLARLHAALDAVPLGPAPAGGAA